MHLHLHFNSDQEWTSEANLLSAPHLLSFGSQDGVVAWVHLNWYQTGIVWQASTLHPSAANGHSAHGTRQS